jgi:prophage regulatory protein
MAYEIQRLPEVEKDTGIKRSTIYRLIGENKFPKQVSLGSRSVGWLKSDIQNWIKQCLAASRMEG